MMRTWQGVSSKVFTLDCRAGQPAPEATSSDPSRSAANGLWIGAADNLPTRPQSHNRVGVWSNAIERVFARVLEHWSAGYDAPTLSHAVSPPRSGVDLSICK